MKAVFVLFAVICLALCTSCDTDSPENLAQSEIRDIFYDLSLEFSLGDVYGMMNHVDNNYLHKGQITWHLNQEILDRLARFQLLEIEVIYIEVNGKFAVAHTKDHYSSSTENVTYNEPEDTGYFSYFHRDRGGWLIYGDQRLIKKGDSDLLAGKQSAPGSEAF